MLLPDARCYVCDACSPPLFPVDARVEELSVECDATIPRSCTEKTMHLLNAALYCQQNCDMEVDVPASRSAKGTLAAPVHDDSHATCGGPLVTCAHHAA